MDSRFFRKLHLQLLSITKAANDSIQIGIRPDTKHLTRWAKPLQFHGFWIQCWNAVPWIHKSTHQNGVTLQFVIVRLRWNYHCPTQPIQPIISNEIETAATSCARILWIQIKCCCTNQMFVWSWGTNPMKSLSKFHLQVSALCGSMTGRDSLCNWKTIRCQ